VVESNFLRLIATAGVSFDRISGMRLLVLLIASAVALGQRAPGNPLEHLPSDIDYEGGKASNPVISTDGRFMAFQSARTTDPAGVGYGILGYWFTK